MPMPRFFRGGAVQASSLNAIAQEVDWQGLAVKVRRTSPMTAQSASTDRIISWQIEDYDTLGGGMWDISTPDRITIRVDGVYTFVCQQRWAGNTGAYLTGNRAGKLLINSTNVFSVDPAAGPFASSITPATPAEGTTFTLVADYPCYVGDRIYTNFWHSASGSIDCLHQDYGGTYLSVTRKSALT